MNRVSTGIFLPAFFLYVLFLITISMFKTMDILMPQIKAMQHWFGGDKNMHLSLAFILGLLGCFASEVFHRPGKCLRASLVVMVLAMGLSVDELFQYNAPHRAFDLRDLGYGVLGLSLAAVFYLFISFVFRRRIGATR